MDNLFYFKEYDTPKRYTDFTGKERESVGKWVCDHPLVDRCYCVGGFSPEDYNTMEMITGLIMKDGVRYEFKGDYDQIKVNKFLNELKH